MIAESENEARFLRLIGVFSCSLRATNVTSSGFASLVHSEIIDWNKTSWIVGSVIDTPISGTVDERGLFAHAQLLSAPVEHASSVGGKRRSIHKGSAASVFGLLVETFTATHEARSLSS
jgi:hypothetical protein